MGSEAEFMEEAVREALVGVRAGDGGPFGAVVVQNGKVISRAHNEVLSSNDPTAHAEILAIRKASSVLKRYDLSDCVIYTTCEPCPMCFAAIHWSRIKRIFFGCDRQGFFDDRRSESAGSCIIFGKNHGFSLLEQIDDCRVDWFDESRVDHADRKAFLFQQFGGGQGLF